MHRCDDSDTVPDARWDASYFTRLDSNKMANINPYRPLAFNKYAIEVISEVLEMSDDGLFWRKAQRKKGC